MKHAHTTQHPPQINKMLKFFTNINYVRGDKSEQGKHTGKCAWTSQSIAQTKHLVYT